MIGNWVKWNGGSNPLGKAKAGSFEVKLRYGTEDGTESIHPADEMFWEHDGAGHDIVAYRVKVGEQ